MAGEQAEQTGQGGQASGQSSSSQGSQQTSASGQQQGSGSTETTQNSQQGGQQQQATTVSRPDWLPESDWDATANTIKPEFGARYKELSAFKAAEDSRRLTLPQKAEDYKLELPKEFKPPDGIEYVPDEKDPRWPRLREHALKNGWSQADVSAILELDAAGQVGTQQQITNAKAAEVQKLGANGTARMTAVNTFVAAIPGVSEAEAKAFERYFFAADQAVVMEKIMAHFRNQGAGTFSQAHREQPAANGKIEGYDKMTFEQKRQAQDRARAGGAR